MQKFIFHPRAQMSLLVFVLLTLSCQKEKTGESILQSENFKLVSFEPLQYGYFKDFANNVEYVVLETNKSFLVSEIDKIETTEDKIFILSKPQKSIFIFDSFGKIINKIADFGEGPGKYQGILDFGINNEFIYCLTDPSKYIYKYDFFGRLIEIIPTNDSFFKEVRLFQNNWAVHLHDSFDKNNNYNFVVWDSAFSQRKNQFLRIDDYRKNGPFTSKNHLSYNNSKMYLTENFSNYVYSANDNKFEIAYEVRINSKGISEDFKKNVNKNPNKAIRLSVEEELFTGFNKIFVTEDVLYLEAMKGGNLISCFLSLQENNSFSYTTLRFEIEYGLGGDIIGTSDDKFIMRVSNSFMNQLKDLDLQGKITNENLKNEKIRNVIQSYEKEGNPVLVFFNFDFSML